MATVKPGVLSSGHILSHHSFWRHIESLLPKADSSPRPSSFLSSPHPPIPNPKEKDFSPCLKQSNPLPPPPGPDGGRGSSPSRKHFLINEEGFQVNLEDKLSSLPDKSVKYLHITYKCWGISGLNTDNRIMSNTLRL